MSVLRWVAGAQSVTDVWTLTLSGTVISQTYTITIGGTTLVYAASGADTATTIMAALGALWNSVANLPPAPFRELSITISTGTIVATQKVTGRPTTITFVSGGSATITCVNTTVATGPSFVDNTANYSTGAIPVNGDTVVLDSGSVPLKYGFGTLAALTTLTLRIDPGYAGRQVGLPDTNTDGTPYHEYRTASWTQAGGTLIVNNPTISLCRINFASTVFTARVMNCGQRIDQNIPVVLLSGGAASSELDLSKGDVGLAFFSGESATVPTVKMGFVSNQAGDAILKIGSGASVTTITKTGGVLDLYHDATTLSQGPNGGACTINDSVTLTTWNVNGGTANFNSIGTVGTINIANDGFLTADNDIRAKTVTNAISLTGSAARLSDANKTINSGVLTYTRTSCPLANINHGPSDGGVLT